MTYPDEPRIRVAPLREFLDLMEALDPIQTSPDEARRWAIREIRTYVDAVSAPQPTLREIEARA